MILEIRGRSYCLVCFSGNYIWFCRLSISPDVNAFGAHGLSACTTCTEGGGGADVIFLTNS